MKLRKTWICAFVMMVSTGRHAVGQHMITVAALRPSPVATQGTGVRVSGQLYNVEGAPYNDPGSRAVLRNGNVIADVSNIGTDGYFEFPGVSPGIYSLSLSGRGIPFSPIIPVRVANTDVRDLKMVVAQAKQVTGQVTLEGGGPLPVIRLQLKPVIDPTADRAVRALSPSGFVTNDAFPGLVPITPMLDFNPRPDGTFQIRIPDGDWNVTVYGGLPTGYAVKAMTYGTADILRSPIKVRLPDTAVIRIVVANSSIQFSKVYGRITGLTPDLLARGKMSVILSGPLTPGPPPSVNTQLQTAAVSADGTFEIDEVLPGDYSAMLTGFDTLDLAVRRLSVTKPEVRDFDFELHRGEIHGDVVVEGGGPMVSTLTLSFKEPQEPGVPVGASNGVSVTIRPLPDGKFTAVFPLLEQLVNIGYGSSCGYKLKSLIYGSTDVLRIPLNVVKADAFELHVTLTYSDCTKR